MCVCERERERERIIFLTTFKHHFLNSPFLVWERHLPKQTHICVTWRASDRGGLFVCLRVWPGKHVRASLTACITQGFETKKKRGIDAKGERERERERERKRGRDKERERQRRREIKKRVGTVCNHALLISIWCHASIVWQMIHTSPPVGAHTPTH